jgi:hypothetical protein
MILSRQNKDPRHQNKATLRERVLNWRLPSRRLRHKDQDKKVLSQPHAGEEPPLHSLRGG